jgi:hypothetical protein
VVNERKRVIERNTEELDRSHQLTLRSLERDYDRETRELQRDERRDDREFDREGRKLDRVEQRGNRLEDREDLKTQRREDRDYDRETREKELGIHAQKERDFGFDGRRKEVDVADKEEYARLARQRETDKVCARQAERISPASRPSRSVNVSPAESARPTPPTTATWTSASSKPSARRIVLCSAPR